MRQILTEENNGHKKTSAHDAQELCVISAFVVYTRNRHKPSNRARNVKLMIENSLM